MLHLTTLLALWLTALPSLPAMPTTPSSPLHKRTPKCHDTSLQLREPIDIVDCMLALNSLPITAPRGGRPNDPTDRVGTFSLNGDLAGQFRLPRHFAHGTCMIGVTMATTGEDTESWNRIAREILGIILLCVQRPGTQDSVGGTGRVGAHSAIQIDLVRNQRYLQFMVELNKPAGPAPAPGRIRTPSTIGSGFNAASR